MNRLTSLLGVLALLAFAGPVAAQEETPPAPEETPEAVAPETPDVAAPETPDTSEVASTHDWEFSLQPNDATLKATAVVMVTEGDAENDFVVEVTGLPSVDQFDTPERDVNAYTVWVAPSKEKVRESTLAGPLSVDPEGKAKFEGKTELDTFGILILATENGAPTSLVGVPVLTGIPAAAAEAADEAAAEADKAAAVADEAAETAEQAADEAEQAAEEAGEAADEAEDEAEEAIPPADQPEAPPVPEREPAPEPSDY